MTSSATRALPEPNDETVGRFLLAAGTGKIDELQVLAAQWPELVHAVGPHPFWGGRPQALHVSIETQRRDVFDWLLAQGANVSGKNDQYDHWSPLMLTVHWDQREMRIELLRRGAEVGLFEALVLADDEQVERILGRSSGLPETVPNSGSPLMFARTPCAIDLLLARGASLDKQDRWGATPIESLSRLGPAGAELVEYLKARGSEPSLAEYARLGDRERLQRFLVDDRPRLLDPQVLMAAVDFRHHDLTRWLIAEGADVNARAGGVSNHTALHSAAWNGDLAMVRLLVERGADRSVRDRQYGGTACDWARVSIDVSNNPACREVVDYFTRNPD